MADEMGLGKTLQAISLAWILSNRGIYGKPLVNKTIIITNSSLVQNWAKEFKKWLGSGRMEPLVCAAKGNKSKPDEILKQFRSGYHKVLIISYNLCINHAELLHDVKCDLLICDEGHKLKNNNIKIFKTLQGITTPHRVVLSGTPVQNDLNEFFCLVDFVNPALLGSEAQFKNVFADPINRSREPSATNIEKEIGLGMYAAILILKLVHNN